MIPKKTEQPLYKQWTRQLKRCNRISMDHQIFANPSAEQAHPSEQFNPGLIYQANFNGVILASHQCHSGGPFVIQCGFLSMGDPTCSPSAQSQFHQASGYNKRKGSFSTR